ncbi:T9SS sorting signal type C domain-containing protein [Flavobacterium sp. RNTU_13]|uniref:T9SS sorting signal type C domain-containing protein n=1 Tax=Flavobacterium sp. RNTU_13 TaxID=3375145 RepID=UPI0039864B1E
MNTFTKTTLSAIITLFMSVSAVSQNQAYSAADITSTLPSRVWINITAPNGGVSQAAIAYLPQCTFGMDFGYDATIFAENNTIALYSIQNDAHLAIQARPAFSNIDEVALGYNATIAGSYTISIDHGDGVFAQQQEVYIKDNVTGTVNKLNDSPYFFDTEAGEFNTRFTLQYTNTTMGTAPVTAISSDVTILNANGLINIQAENATINALRIYDINGRTLFTQNSVNAQQTSVSSVAAQKQVLIVQVMTDKGVTSKRIVY